MIRILPLFLALLTGISAGPALARRDPFWPIGYRPAEAREPSRPAAEPEAPPPPAEEARSLTDAELGQLVREEAERIRRTATMQTGNQIYAYVQNKWVTVGDSFTVEVLGKKYRLKILGLTEENIELEPHRIGEQPPPTKNATTP